MKVIVKKPGLQPEICEIDESVENRKKIILSVFLSVFAIIVGVSIILLSGLAEIETWARIVLIVIGFVVVFGCIAVSAVLDFSASIYEYPNCHKRFVPKFSHYISGTHTIRKRHLKCPYCRKSSFCNRKLTH